MNRKSLRRTARSAWLGWPCLLLLSAAPLPAQEGGTVEFDPSDLEQWLQCYYGPNKEHYDFAPFERFRGKRVTKAKLEELERLWAEERARVAKKLADLADRPVAKFFERVRSSLNVHPFFTRIEYSEVVEDRFAFYIERPRRTVPFYDRKLVNTFMPRLRELERRYEGEYARPLGLQRNEELPAYAISILATKGSYNDFADAAEVAGLYRARAHYDPLLRLVVSYEDLFADDRATEEERRAIQHEFVHALQHAYFSGREGTMPRPTWFAEGQAEYLAVSVGANGHHRVPPIASLHLREFVSLFDKGLGAFAGSIEDLVTCTGPGYLDVFRRARERAGNVMPDEAFVQATLVAFYAEASLFTHFMHHAHDGRYRPAYRRYARAVMNGARGWQTFVDALGERADPVAVEAEFIGYLRENHRRLWPTTAVPPIALRGSGLGAAEVAADPPDSPAATPAPSELALAGDEWRARLGHAFALAGRGRYEDALARIRGLAPAGAEAAARLRRARQRLTRIIALRDDLLREGRFVSIDVREGDETRKVRGRVRDVAGGVVRIEKSFGKVDEIPLAAFGPANLEAEAGKSRNADLGVPSWLRGYLLALAGAPERSYARRLRGAGAAAVATDLEERDELARLGGAAALVEALARGPLPEEPAAARAAFARVKKLLGEYGDTPLVQARRDELRAYAEAVLHRAFDPTDRECLGIRGNLRAGEDGKVTLSYDFEDAAAAADFVRARDYLEHLRDTITKRLPDGRITSDAELASGDGELEYSGAACHRLALPFAAPMRVRFDAEFGGGYFLVGICASPGGDYVAVDMTGSIIVQDSAAGVAGQVPAKTAGVYAERTYGYEIRHDGSSVTSSIDGEVQAKATNVGKRTGGYVFVWVHSTPPVRVSGLTVEGKLDESGLGRLRADWVAEQMKGL